VVWRWANQSLHWNAPPNEIAPGLARPFSVADADRPRIPTSAIPNSASVVPLQGSLPEGTVVEVDISRVKFCPEAGQCNRDDRIQQAGTMRDTVSAE